MPTSPAMNGALPHHLSSQQVQEIHARFGHDLFAFLLGVLKDRNAADDALQQTFQRVAERGGSVQPDTLRGWLFQVAFHEAMLIRRKESRDDRHMTAWWLEIGRNRDQPAPDHRLVTQEETERVRQALARLPDEQRIIVERRIHHQETFAQIAERLNLPLGTVLTRMRLATQALRKWLHDR